MNILEIFTHISIRAFKVKSLHVILHLFILASIYSGTCISLNTIDPWRLINLFFSNLFWFFIFNIFRDIFYRLLRLFIYSWAYYSPKTDLCLFRLPFFYLWLFFDRWLNFWGYYTLFTVATIACLTFFSNDVWCYWLFRSFRVVDRSFRVIDFLFL